jgi:hypothetical protein
MTDDAKRCGTCAYWQRGHVSAWGECLWALRIARPWWYTAKHSLREKTTETEGENENCKAWERKP